MYGFFVAPGIRGRSRGCRCFEVLAVLAAAVCLFTASQADSEEGRRVIAPRSGQPYVAGEMIVKLKSGADPGALADLDRVVGSRAVVDLAPKYPAPDQRIADLTLWLEELKNMQSRVAALKLSGASDELESFAGIMQDEAAAAAGQIEAALALKERLERRQRRAPKGAPARRFRRSAFGEDPKR